ncbi:LysR family transcriptional regulator [Flavimobilis marinus]|uniref:Enamine deaminase RidA, house cleaning of reactive enamine intermediates, YjgF/YER057c/UK114 family n=1 Tax=Flavimobilis marinus TaxID=285351 RepID=A0A1I2CLW8_9MICO|nr:RidA family protein [Flavimobilis marinus]GHG47397.1 LysR family transcriptional regulator [Flavimobilis marinus]SFE69132.1 Enamine deaminase RidA, house cleaning of reactive enamine intermediates, YjgF/YER057c/UK114 family [Flavimobilis marinus]
MSQTGQIAARLAELGLELPPVAAPLASYVPAVRSGDHVYTSGQLPFVDGALPATGKVGDGPTLVDPAAAATLARTAVLNALAAVRDVVGNLDDVVRVVKVVGFVASDPAFTGQPAVVNGASELLGQVFGAAGVHARSAVGVAVLPLDSPVEVELIVEVR